MRARGRGRGRRSGRGGRGVARGRGRYLRVNESGPIFRAIHSLNLEALQQVQGIVDSRRMILLGQCTRGNSGNAAAGRPGANDDSRPNHANHGQNQNVSGRPPSSSSQKVRVWDRSVLRKIPCIQEWGKLSSANRSSGQSSRTIARYASVISGVASRGSKRGFSEDEIVARILEITPGSIAEASSDALTRVEALKTLFQVEDGHQDTGAGRAAAFAASETQAMSVSSETAAAPRESKDSGGVPAKRARTA